MAAVWRAVQFVSSWSLSDWSSFAAVLCAIDCTVLPALVAVLPVLGLIGDAEGAHEQLHHYSHLAAFYVVLPLGLITLVINYTQHRRPHLLLWGLLGLSIVFVAHSHHRVPLPHWLHEIVHHHTAVGVLGSAVLISSNFFSHRAIHGHGAAGSHTCCEMKGRCHAVNGDRHDVGVASQAKVN
ncbi:MerC mercury resistance protein [Toxoplasma gondii TgCatPRC2]|uniref:MerC mercury resistance protein n=10 Tax=Toxoplasma gondii TaxID=5811 RepID=B9QNZ6_TOXGV|nr:hypothetical protein TGME49_263240 [Toxoplasma gondii ME49]ESS31856.1 MerC mercury resistance protein [Toxoplasma gondii VEG]KFG30917.1 MerC mercury resistance protein [Toxoplasma gondii GAB2-2007-GAL-DOM2]KFG34916.1 MerC mercury resistance protein [Toxoplasma gondii p89]KFG52577.1 MerC mercury resistance protein [Toxoplasma gondii FOU]KFG65569.1 MerC mercury resistance protein [Toxoplasma gondii RUB]KFH10279.1 MerC mercury resistance protein [Toxoplasma gondii VAND]KYF40767.1 MerC mercur|eukprot:XP_018637155.1 hypothetical protein TGME49_263240 [Toxoplasma gondii ME49]